MCGSYLLICLSTRKHVRVFPNMSSFLFKIHLSHTWPNCTCARAAHITPIVVVLLSAEWNFQIFETSGSSRQTCRQTDIWAISPTYLSTSHPVLIITALLNCTNWWRKKTQCPIFVCFLPHFWFWNLFACAHPLIPKKRVILSTGLDVLVKEEASTVLSIEFASQG